MSSIVAKDLIYKFGEKVAVDIPHLNIEPGDLFGLIGPDGAGKTTLFRLIATLFKPHSGSLSIMGNDSIKDFSKIRKFTGYMPGRFSLYEDLTVRENLKFFASVFNTSIEENYHLIEDIYSMLKPFEKRKAGALSGGMKQKLALSCALIHKPNILLLDEPTTGVDPVSRKELWDMLLKLQGKDITIVVSTPYMDEATNCNKIALMQNSKILDVASPQEIVKKYKPRLWHITTNKFKALTQDLRDFSRCNSSYSFGNHIHYSEATDITENASKQGITDYLKQLGHEQITIEIGTPLIEDCFIEYMQVEDNDNRS